MNFKDSQLRECYERNLSEMTGFSNEIRQVCALIATHDFFQMMEGPHSERVHETLDCLLSPVLRPGLREWYQRSSADINAGAIAFRNQLSQLAGEKLETAEEASLNPS
jgi:hypothetical protein